MPLTTFKSDVGEIKEEATELTARTGGKGHTYAYIMPPKFLALERGDGARFLHETSLSNDDTETYPLLVPHLIVKCKKSNINIIHLT